MSETSFPRQQARTRRFTLGVPRNFAIAADGGRVAFLRTHSGSDPTTCLWQLDVATGAETLVVDPTQLEDGDVGVLADEERARRERAREAAGGIVRLSADRALERAVFDLSGRLYAVDMRTHTVHQLPASGTAVDPRLDPTGAAVAYVAGGALRVVGVDGRGDHTLTAPESEDVTYGLAEFVAAEEMDRQNGYWWSPDGSRLLVARVDVSRVQRWYIADPSNPGTRPAEVAYPVAGSDNAQVRLFVVDLRGRRVPVRWDATRFEYLTTADWSTHGLLVVVQSRDQRTMQILEVDPDTGETSLVREDSDDVWLDIVEGVPAWLTDGSLVWSADRDGAKRLLVGEEAVTDPGLQLRAVLDVDGDEVLFSASNEPTEVGVWTWSPAQGVTHLIPGDDSAGVHNAHRTGGTTVLVRRGLESTDVRVSVHREGREVAQIASRAETPVIKPNAQLARLGHRELRAAVLFPSNHVPDGGKLPVLLDPYGGPHFQKVSASLGAYLESQWFADQGFVVLVVDGRGTPGRGPQWDRTIRGDLASPALDDQVDALLAAAERWSDIDLSRVAIRGWSYGGYLAALAVLRRPDVFHVAVAGAPVSDMRLYDTFYTERYLGHPNQEPANYERSSLLSDAARLERPLMLIHGLSDDNVVVAHTLRLSQALFAAGGRPHTVLPLPGVTHVTNHEAVAENLLLMQLDFIQRALGLPSYAGGG